MIIRIWTPGIQGALIGLISAPVIVLFCWSVTFIAGTDFFSAGDGMGMIRLVLRSLASYMILYTAAGVAAGNLGVRQPSYSWAFIIGVGLGIGLSIILHFVLINQEADFFSQIFQRTLLLPTVISTVFSSVGTFYLHRDSV